MGANSKIPNEIPFSITARTALLLGRESVSSPIVAILELVKNAYDADAKQVTVKFSKASTPKGTIEIIDNGHGMSWEDIRTKWMIVGTNNKQIRPRSPKGRLRVGEKGIGRFALDRLAGICTLITTSLYKPSEPTYRLVIRWNKFLNTNKQLQEVSHPVRPLQRMEQSGTQLLLRNLRDKWTQRDYERLYQNLAVLIPPFETRPTDFGIEFICDERPDLSGKIRSPMAEAALFKMIAKLGKSGKAKIVITTRDGSPDGRFQPFRKYTRTWHELVQPQEDESPSPQCGPVLFEFYFYLRGSSGIKGASITVGQLTEFLDVYGGIRIYRDGFRVKPYGDPGGTGDWLGLNYRRVKSPSGVKSPAMQWVVAENQVAGSVFVSRRANPDLKDQTNREGLFNNQAFRDMRTFALKCLELFETDRQSYERGKQDKASPTTRDVLAKAQQDFVEAAKQLEEALANRSESPENAALQATLKEYSEAQVRKLEELATTYETEQEETINKLHLLQNTATVGIAVSAMGHEVLETSRHIADVARRLREQIKGLMLLYDPKIKQYTQRLERYGQIMYAMSNFALGHIDRDKRQWRKLNLDTEIGRLTNETLVEMCNTNSAHIEFIPGGVPDIYAFPFELESIVINFVTNSLAAFRRGYTPMKDRQIEIETQYIKSANQIKLIARDSGPGIPKGDSERIFEIYSTKVDNEGKPIGTGLGLVIVKDIVESHKGTINVREHGKKLRGAEFIVMLPIPKERGRKRRTENGEKG